MKRIIFSPLKEDYKLIQVRSSQLNNFFNESQYKFTSTDAHIEVMLLWDKIHDIVQYTMLMWEEKWHERAEMHIKEVENMWPFVKDSEWRWFIKSAHQYVELSKQYTVDCIEQKRQLLIEYSWYLVWFSGQTDWELWFNIGRDIKSSAKKRDDERAYLEKQKYYYTRLKCLFEWWEYLDYYYDIYTKQLKPQHQSFHFHITMDNAEQVVKNDLRVFLSHTHLNEIQLQWTIQDI